MPTRCEMVMWKQWALFFPSEHFPGPITIGYGFVSQREQDVLMWLFSQQNWQNATVFKRWVHSIRNAIHRPSMWPQYFHLLHCHLFLPPGPIWTNTQQNSHIFHPPISTFVSTLPPFLQGPAFVIPELLFFHCFVGYVHLRSTAARFKNAASLAAGVM